MSRVHAVIAACLLSLGTRAAHADAVELNVSNLEHGEPMKVRLAATLSLAKSTDPRAVIAVSRALDRDDSTTVRRVAALALAKMIIAATADDARSIAFTTLDRAARSDRDPKVRTTATNTLKAIAGQRKQPTIASSVGAAPAVFINIDTATDQSKRAPADARDRLAKIVKRNIERTGYSTSWPGGLPTSKDLSSSNAQAYIVASTVKKLDVTKGGNMTTIACTVAIRVAPWGGKDSGEKWEANRAASASGSAKAQTGNSEREINGGMRDCL